MRRKIIHILSNLYNKNDDDILMIVENYSSISQYQKNNIKGRIVIDKSSISQEEQIVLDYYKLLINYYCFINFPNRSYIMSELMNIMPYLHLYKRYTIYKFDFKDFFYSIDPKTNFKYIENSIMLNPIEYDFLYGYTKGIESYIPGVGIHNSLIEVSGQKFDIAVKNTLKNKGLIYYSRYVDDCILLMDEKIQKNLIEKEINKLMVKFFGKSLCINQGKTSYKTDENIDYEIDYLGYVFKKGQSINKSFSIGIAESKLIKYKEKINKIILDYKEDQKIEVLSLKLEMLFKRLVFYGNKGDNTRNRWQVRGISDSYKELKRFMPSNENLGKITNGTQNLFNNTIEQAFNINRVKIPAKIKNQIINRKFISCFLNNKALVLHKKIGLNHQELKGILSILYDGNLENFNYNDLASLFLREIKK